ncbi:hypothetical protein B0H14DRAFT_1164431 [Mycena olivaceomarginata]|nr:hypothetical protein B0H14DRAFT_1164431 [Mycena olivaceomarginata]
MLRGTCIQSLALAPGYTSREPRQNSGSSWLQPWWVCLSGCPELGRWDTPDLSLIHRSASDHRIITEHAFYANPNHAADTVKTASMLVAIVVGDALMIYRLWIVWGRNRTVLIFPSCSLTGLLVAALGILYVFLPKSQSIAKPHF